MLDSDIATYEQRETDRRERERPTGLISDLGPGVCQICGSMFGMRCVPRSTLIRCGLGDEVVYRHRDDPVNADFVWLICLVCTPNLNGFHAMGNREYNDWLNGHPSIRDDHPERIL